jgi:hypothetical protein
MLTAASLALATAIAEGGGFAQGPKLVGAGASGAAMQGSSVAISKDGSTALVGGLSDASNAGAVWVFTRSAGLWAPQGGKLVGTGVDGFAQQGKAVGLSADGNTALVGGQFDNNGSGAAWVFTRGGGVWTQQGPKLVGSGAIGLARQGWAVAISGDGNTALVGGPNDAFFNGSATGAAWVYTRSDGGWTQQGGKLVGSGSFGSPEQGTAVALSFDGSTALVAGPYDTSLQGGVWVFTRTNGVWTQQGQKLLGADAAGAARQGVAVALSADGNTALIGGEADAANVGAAWVFTRSGGAWTQQGGKLVGSGAIGAASQGHSVSLSGDGSTALVGGPNDDASTGAVWMFTRAGGVWSQNGGKLVGTAAVGAASQAWSLAISADGATAIAGGSADASNTGAAWVFMRPCAIGDASGNALVDVADVFFLINFLFAGGPAPSACF